jgi:hypothetical protein
MNITRAHSPVESVTKIHGQASSFSVGLPPLNGNRAATDTFGAQERRAKIRFEQK